MLLHIYIYIYIYINFYRILDLIFLGTSLFVYYKLLSSNPHNTFFQSPTDTNVIWHDGYNRKEAPTPLAYIQCRKIDASFYRTRRGNSSVDRAFGLFLLFRAKHSKHFIGYGSLFFFPGSAHSRITDTNTRLG